MSSMTYNYGGMMQGEASIAKARTDLAGIKSDIDGAMVTLGGSWTEGTDLAAYRQYQRAWAEIFHDVGVALEALRVALAGSVERAQHVERVNTGNFEG